MLEFTLNYEPSFSPLDYYIPVGNIANFPYSVIGFNSHVLSREEGYIDNNYVFTYALNKNNIAEIDAVASSQENPRLREKGASFQLYF